MAPDNVQVLACRDAAPPPVLFRQAAEAQVFAALAEAHWAGLPASDNVPEAGPVTRLVVALQRARGLRLSSRQAEVALLILRGHSTPSIALVPGVSAPTAKLFRRQVRRRCGVSTRAAPLALMLPLPGEGARR